MKLYQKFKISEEILPPSYEKGGVDIQIKGINHTVNNSGWKTKLDTQSVPAAKLSPVATSYPLNAYSGTVSSGGGGGGGTQRNVPYKGPFLDGDPAPTINPTGIGATYYTTSLLSKKFIDSKNKNGLLNQTDKTLLVFIGEYRGANKLYPNPANNNKPEYMLNPIAAEAWYKWRDEMNEKEVKFRVSSGYRSRTHQSRLGAGAAGVGSSPHGTGGAIDFSNLYGIVGGSTTAAANLKGRKTGAYEQIASIGAKYGWYNPKRLAKGSGMNEIWHFEYWGSV